ncbi:thioester reductase domain-containing protein [Clavibacter michiganensis]|uniref:thioester reductase domain-containing protein n=1 Tax=Clavibacter michiganensis TaxID=28447 RepID=UPI0026DAE3A6|nr:thioester reductase domain-containing protein [Clavibacter michiganensis]MDO4130174.1 thioester reductase domain-containing protein [Clavibacter michiganensis]MDO4137407.1 thioester reductase domain-containing protein [Clavibacter michiganensis]
MSTEQMGTEQMGSQHEDTSIEAIFAQHADRTALRQRSGPDITDMGFRELWDRASALAAALGETVSAGDRIAVLGTATADAVTLDLAAWILGAVSVPLQASAPVAALRAIVEETTPVWIAATADQAATARAVTEASGDGIRTMRLDTDTDADTDAALTLGALVARGAGLPTRSPWHPAPGDDPLALLLYTSGSTGTPKGAMYTRSMVERMWHALRPDPAAPADASTTADDGDAAAIVGYAYLPLSHLTGRAALLATLGRGGTVALATSTDLSTLFDDLRTFAPTEFVFVPRVAEMVRQEGDREQQRRLAAGSTDVDAVRAEVQADLRVRAFGGRIHRAICTSAPLTPELRTYIEGCLGLTLHDLYGSTEAGGILHDGVIQQPPVTEHKLVDVPELGYRTTDRPHPRGELLVKSASVIAGYFRRPDVTAAVFDEDGFYRTGDVMAQTGPGTYEYVDRRNNVIKLSQGEFVAVASLEATYGGTPEVHQIALHGDSRHAFLVAVVVPADPAASERDILAALQRTAREHGLAPYEVPRGVIVEPDPFTVDGGMLSDAGKLLRLRLTQRYGERLAALYDALEEQQSGTLVAALRERADDEPTVDTVVRAALLLLGAEVSPATAAAARFSDLGGDSLSALTFSGILEDVFGTEVPVGVLTDPTNDLAAVAAYVERSASDDRPTVTHVHGAGASTLRVGDLRLDRMLGGIPTPVPRASATRPGSRTVLLTGANGYLGRFLAIDWLERLAATGGTLVCIVRGADDADARRRLEAAFAADPAFARRFAELAGSLEVLAGDVSERRLGLDEERWIDLAARVDLVAHAAALVNHVLPYSALFGPNVVGTAEAIRLAIAAGSVPVTFVSSVAVAGGARPGATADAEPSAPGALDEHADIRATIPEWAVGDEYANGYGASKWASEVLLREAHEHHGVPVAVFRSDMILAHPRWRGQVNLPDVFTRLIWSVLTTGLAPASFVRRGPDGERQRSHYDGLPADFTAAAIDGIGAALTEGHRTFNVVNPHDDGVSLDTFVDWIREDGHDIARVDDHAEWVDRFRAALGALPDADRARSVLPLMHAFASPEEPHAGSAIPADAFAEAVRAVRPLGSPDIPSLDHALIAKVADDLAFLGLLAPARAAAA